ncbi:MAG: hypothetical protein LIP11_07645 [Clostridiales bacterium]|nr:hypothetical protein [Clostridiales bacterium]
MLGINARVEDLRDQIIKDINRAQMPACLLDYVLTEVLNEVRMTRESEVQKERKKYREEMTPAPGEAPVARKGDGQGGIVEAGRVRMEQDGTVKEEGADDNDNPDS